MAKIVIIVGVLLFTVKVFGDDELTTASSSIQTTTSTVSPPPEVRPSNMTPSAQAHMDLTQITCDLQCQNVGTCKMRDTEAYCACQEHYTGDTCEFINLKLPTYDVTKSGITFFWSNSFSLSNFSVLTLNVKESDLKIEPINDFDNRSRLDVTGLKPDKTEYLVCIVPDAELDNRTVDDIKKDLLDVQAPNCGRVLTAYDGLGPYTMAAFGVAAAMAGCLLALAVCRGGANCKEHPERDSMIASVMGTWHKLRGQPSTKNKTVDTNGTENGTMDNGTEHMEQGVANTAFNGDMPAT